MITKKWLTVGVIAALMFGALALTGCAGANDSADSTEGTEGAGVSGSIDIEGSDTIVNLGQAWAETFMGENPEVIIAVKGGGSGTGIAALINGTVDAANASREMKDEEIAEAQANGVDPIEHTVAFDGIAVVVNPANGVAGLTLEQLGAIYRGEITNWKDVGGQDKKIVLLSRDSSSGTYEYFKEAVVAVEDETLDYAKQALLLPSTQAIVDEVKGNADAIGYVGVGYVTSDVKVLEIDGVAASVDTVLDKTYPLSRGLYMYSAGEPTGALAAYLEWILSDAGQAIVEEQGFVPVAK